MMIAATLVDMAVTTVYCGKFVPFSTYLNWDSEVWTAFGIISSTAMVQVVTLAFITSRFKGFSLYCVLFSSLIEVGNRIP